MTPTDHPVPPRSPHPADHHSHDDHLYDDPLHNEDVAHEHSDINVRAVIVFAVGLAAVVGVCALTVFGLFKVFEQQARANDPVLSPLVQPAGQLPPEPRLLIDEPQNLQNFRTALSGRLTMIDEAKKRLLEQGLPVRPDAPIDAWIGTNSSSRGESTGGRGIPLKPGAPGEAAPAPASAPPAAPATPPKSGGH